MQQEDGICDADALYEDEEEKKSDLDIEEAEKVFGAYAQASEKGDVQETTEAMMKVMQHLAEHQDDEPSPWLEAMQQAHSCEAAFDWHGAEAAYHSAVDATRQEKEPQGRPGLQSSTYRSLTALYLLLDKHEAAREAARLAVETAEAADSQAVHWMALQLQAGVHLKLQDLSTAKTLIDRAFNGISDEPLQDINRAHTLILRAEYYVAGDDLAAAEADLTTAWPLIEPWSDMYFAGGWQNALASWRHVTAMLCTQQGNDNAGVEAWRQAVQRRRIVAQLPQLEGPYKHNSLAVALRHLGQAQRAAGDSLANHSFAESCSIRRSIGLPPLED